MFNKFVLFRSSRQWDDLFTNVIDFMRDGRKDENKKEKGGIKKNEWKEKDDDDEDDDCDKDKNNDSNASD